MAATLCCHFRCRLRLAQISSIAPVPTDLTIPGAAVTPPFAFKVHLATRVLYLHAKTADDVRALHLHLCCVG
jgi:hypothetical protein